MKIPLLIVALLSIAACKNNTPQTTIASDKIAHADTNVMKRDTSSKVLVKDDEGKQPVVLTIDVESANVIIDTSGTGKVHILNATNNREVTYKETLSEYSVEIVSKGKSDEVINPGRIEVHIPGNSMITCKMMSGDLKIKQVHCRYINAETMSGNIILTDATMSKGKINTMSGNLNFSAKVDSGNIGLSSMSGNVSIFLNEQSNVKLKLSSDGSNVLFNGIETDNNAMSKVLGSGKGMLSAKTMSGDVGCVLRKNN